ncbi:Uncharacterised protein [Burkholderia pseudomallei]|nr:Uncharacterised protein [Burkholderia pseudomallei]
MVDLIDGPADETVLTSGLRCLAVELRSADNCGGRFTVMITRSRSLVLSPMLWQPDDPLMEICSADLVLFVGDEERERWQMDGTGWRLLSERCLVEKVWTRVLLGEPIADVMASVGLRFRQ